MLSKNNLLYGNARKCGKFYTFFRFYYFQIKTDKYCSLNLSVLLLI